MTKASGGERPSSAVQAPPHLPGPGVPAPLVESPRIRTYAGRRGRMSALTRDRLELLLPARALPAGLLGPLTLGRDAPVVLDMGCGHGAAAVGYAAAHPGHDVVAVDVHRPAIARLLAAADHAGVANLRVDLGDGVALLVDRVPPGFLAAVHLFFPDPWPKRKHAKRRLVQPEMLSLLASRLRAEGHVLVATDDPRHAAYVQSQAESHGAFAVCVVARPTWRPVAGFEHKALAAGRSVVDLRLDLRR